MKRTILAGAVAAIATIALAGPASASVTIDDTGKGFVGKGDVQLKFGWNNAQLQTNASGVSFSAAAEATQVFTQSATQSAFQTSVESYDQYVTCTTPLGQSGRFKIRQGERSGKATAKRTSTRSATRTGSLSGTVASSIDYVARRACQESCVRQPISLLSVGVTGGG